MSQSDQKTLILSQDKLLPNLRDALNKIKSKYGQQFYAWKLNVLHYESRQSLMICNDKNTLEQYQNRNVLDHSYQIVVYTNHSEPKLMGSSSFNIDPLNNLEDQIDKTYQNSLLVGNKPWKLPTKINKDYEKVLTCDPIIKDDLNSAHNNMISEINESISSLDGVKVNSLELYTNLQTTYFETSEGFNGQKDNSDIYFEMAIEKLPLPNTQEILKYKKAISIEDANLSSFIKETSDEAMSISETIVPKTSSNLNIIIDGEAISSLLTKLTGHLNAGREYEKSPFMKKGDSILSTDKISGSDSINLTLDPTTPVMALSTPFTSEGMSPVKANVIKDNIVTNQLIHERIAQYLSKEPNYILGNIILDLGDLSKTELIDSVEECIEILSFSSLLINPNTLTWSSEIKLGKMFKNGKLVSMVKGGVISGDIKINLTNFKLSNQEVKVNEIAGGFDEAKGYVGPSHMLIQSGIKVVGE